MCSFFAFIAASSEIYILGFDVSAQAFGMYFGINALSLMAGSFICMKLVMKLTDNLLLSFGFGGMVIGGLLLMVMPHSQVWFFTLPMCCISFGFGLTRPLCVNIASKINIILTLLILVFVKPLSKADPIDFWAI